MNAPRQIKQPIDIDTAVAGVALVDNGRQVAPLGNDDLPRGQRRHDHVGQELGPRRREQQRLGNRSHRPRLRRQQDLAQRLTHRCRTRLAHMQNRTPFILEPRN